MKSLSRVKDPSLQRKLKLGVNKLLLVFRKKNDLANPHILDNSQQNLDQVQGRYTDAPIKFAGVFGTFDVNQETYLILIDTVSLFGTILGAEVYRVESLKFVPYGAKEIRPQDKKYIDMIQNVQKNKCFYFSYRLDLTKRFQTILKELQEPYHRMRELYPNSIGYVDKFCFNADLLSALSGDQYAPIRTPCIYGYVGIRKVSSDFQFTLISRRDRRRAGRRFVSRGLNDEGAAANFTETEHLLEKKIGSTYKIASHLQIRGSIPLKWEMKPDLKWEPHVKVENDFMKNYKAAKLHCTETQKSYEAQYFVNLIDKKKQQGRIGNQMTDMLGRLRRDDENLYYTWFDFHQECKKMKYENLSKLVKEVSSQLDHWGYLIAELNHGLIDYKDLQINIKQVQSGVMRTNCMDCLDRTNVVQSVFSRNIIHKQLAHLGFQSNANGAAFQQFNDQVLERSFKEIWTNNADQISIMYTGTPALKTDFTRTGKRTKAGEMQDAKHSIIRYYIGNFTDGYNVDCLEVCSKKLRPGVTPIKPRSALTPIRKAIGFYFLLMFGLSIFLNSYLPKPEEDVTSILKQEDQSKNINFVHNMVYLLFTFFIGAYVQSNGRKFTDDSSRSV